MTGTNTEIVPILRIDGHPIGRGEVGSVTRQIQEAFRARTEASNVPD